MTNEVALLAHWSVRQKLNCASSVQLGRSVRAFIGCLHDQENIELAQAGLLELRPWLKCRPRLRPLAHS